MWFYHRGSTKMSHPNTQVQFLELSKTLKCALTDLGQMKKTTLLCFATIIYTYSVKVIESVDFSDIYTLYSLRRDENAKTKFQFDGVCAQYVIF